MILRFYKCLCTPLAPVVDIGIGGAKVVQYIHTARPMEAVTSNGCLFPLQNKDTVPGLSVLR